MQRLAVIADDLTGANDTGVQFAKAGHRTVVLISGSNILNSPTAAVTVIDTDSRSDRPAVAYGKVYSVASSLHQLGVRTIYKKVDSTLRGNIGAEIEAAVMAIEPDFAVIAPAFPRNSRITVGGFHLLNQQPLETTELAHDPKTPVTESRLPELLRQQTNLSTKSIDLSTVIEGPGAVAAAIQACQSAGARLLVFDATTEQHLKYIAQAAAGMGRKVLWVGSAGLAEVLPNALGWCPSPIDYCPQMDSRPVLLMSGSVSRQTGMQIKALLDRKNTLVIPIEPLELLEASETMLKKFIQTAKHGLATQQDIVMYLSDWGTEVVERTLMSAGRQGINPEKVSQILVQQMGKMAAGIVDEEVGGIVLTGGDTAVNVCRALAASGIELLREVDTGIPLGILYGGRHSGLPVITKAGAFGSEDVLSRAMTILRMEKELVT